MQSILELANVPEHSLPFMEAMSGGKAQRHGDYLFYRVEDGLLGVAYPLEGEYSHEGFEQALNAAQAGCRGRFCAAVGPDLPPRLQASIYERDVCLTLAVGPANVPPPGRLAGQVQRAGQALTLRQGKDFTAQHRRLWAEMLARPGMREQVRRLFSRSESVLRNPACGELLLLDAVDAQGHLAASLLVDFNPARFCTYVIGAHSRLHYAPHATDLLFAAMLEEARQRGKGFIHLGQGVNPGIRRFKEKWGGRPALPLVMARWELEQGGMAKVVNILLRSESQPLSKVQAFQRLPQQSSFAMLWEVEKNGVKNWLGGTAHFFCCSFSFSLERLFARVDTVLLEGPLDQASLERVSAVGCNLNAFTGPDCSHLPGLTLEGLFTEAEILRLERMVQGPQGRLARWLNAAWPRPADVRGLIRHSRHWHAFFSLWTAFLERNGWQQSVDLEIWELAHDLGKRVVPMESIAEQIASLELVPLPRVQRFFRDCHLWPANLKRNRQGYLKGDLEHMLGSSAEFPTRIETIIDHRDQRFVQRMLPYMEQGGCAVFVGSAHLLGMRRMLTQRGWNMRQVRPERM